MPGGAESPSCGTYDGAVALSNVVRMSLPTPRRDIASLPQRLSPPMPSHGWRGWIGPLIVTAIGGIIRMFSLGRPHAFMFDEVYYAKEGISMLRYGYEQAMVEKANDIILASDGNWRTLDIFRDAPAFVVHPPVGKWVIGFGEYFFGATPFGWRIAVSILGTLSILMVARTVRRMTRSDLIGILAGLLLAVEGLHIVMSRSSLLDLVLSFFCLLGFCLLVLDRDLMRARLARRVTTDGLDSLATAWGPRLGIRPLRWAAGISLGLATGVKWSGIWFIAVFAIMTVLWDLGARRAIGVGRPFTATLVRSALPTFVSMVVLGIVTYIASWWGWFIHPQAYGRQWGSADPSLIPQALRALWHYHVQAWDFSVHLTADHSYQSNPLSWMLQTRPVSFYWDGKGTTCGSSACAAAVTGLGNPMIWWSGCLALIYMLWRWAARRDWRSGAILAGIVAGWFPWFLFLDRTVFSMYAVVFVPYVVMAVAMMMGAMLGPTPDPGAVPEIADRQRARRTWGALAAGGLLVLIVFCGWWFYPVWTAVEIPYDMWRLRMWMPTWV